MLPSWRGRELQCSRHVTNELRALPLIRERAWMIESPPAVGRALINIPGRSAASFVCRNRHRRRFSRCRENDVVDDDIGSINVPSTMDAAIPLFETLARGELLFSATSILNSQRAALYSNEDVARVVVHRQRLAGLESQLSHCQSHWTLEHP